MKDVWFGVWEPLDVLTNGIMHGQAHLVRQGRTGARMVLNAIQCGMQGDTAEPLTDCP